MEMKCTMIRTTTRNATVIPAAQRALRLLRSPALRPVLFLVLVCSGSGCDDIDPPIPTVVKVSPVSPTLQSLQQSIQLTATVQDQHGQAMTGVTFTWATSDVSVVSVGTTGLVTARVNGSATVTATAGSAVGNATITVKQFAAEVVVTPSADTLVAFGDTVRLAAEARDANGHPVAGARITWRSRDTAVASIDSAGVVTAEGNGTATIAATEGGATGEADVTVRQSVDSVVVTPALASVVLGTTLGLTAEAFDGNGHRVEGALFEWASSDVRVAPVDAGLVTGVAWGTATIAASVESARGTSGITVVESPDRAELVALYEATDGPNWAERLNWSTDVPLNEWFGVKMGSTGLVTELALPANNLRGDIPAELGNLSSLEELEFWGNQLTGDIPPELGNLSSLGLLGLAANQLTGEIPPELANLANLANLENLFLFGNELTGEIPPELGLLANLRSLALLSNRLTGEIPPELGDLVNLNYLYVGHNSLTGGIPRELGNLVNLRNLDLGDNGLTGEIPPELGDLAQLGELYLNNNQLSGPIPAELGTLDELSRLVGHDNELTGALPPEFGGLGSLEDLQLSNNDLSGPVPPEFGDLVGLSRLAGRGRSGPLGNRLWKRQERRDCGFVVHQTA